MTKLQDFPEFKKAIEKLRALEDEQRQKKERKNAIQSEANVATPAARVAFHQRWREEFQELEGQEPLLLEQIESAKREVDRVRGQVSLEICKPHRPQFLKQVRRILRALKELSDANDQISWLRHELEADGIVTGSIPHCVFQMDRWSDKHGGQVTGYQRWIRENFPELKDDTY